MPSVIQVFTPRIRYVPSWSVSACVSIAAVFEPIAGSLIAKLPIVFPEARRGSQVSSCCSEPADRSALWNENTWADSPKTRP